MPGRAMQDRHVPGELREPLREPCARAASYPGAWGGTRACAPDHRSGSPSASAYLRPCDSPALLCAPGRAKLHLGVLGAAVLAGDAGEVGCGVAAVEGTFPPARALGGQAGLAESRAGGAGAAPEPDVVGDGLTPVAFLRAARHRLGPPGLSHPPIHAPPPQNPKPAPNTPRQPPRRAPT